MIRQLPVSNNATYRPKSGRRLFSAVSVATMYGPLNRKFAAVCQSALLPMLQFVREPNYFRAVSGWEACGEEMEFLLWCVNEGTGRRPLRIPVPDRLLWLMTRAYLAQERA